VRGAALRAAARVARVARFRGRVLQDRPDADRGPSSRRRDGRPERRRLCVRSDRAVVARLRVLGRADQAGHGPRARRPAVRQAHGQTRTRQVLRARRRLGRRRIRSHFEAVPGQVSRVHCVCCSRFCPRNGHAIRRTLNVTRGELHSFLEYFDGNAYLRHSYFRQ